MQRLTVKHHPETVAKKQESDTKAIEHTPELNEHHELVNYIHFMLSGERNIQQLTATLRYNFLEVPQNQFAELISRLKRKHDESTSELADAVYLKEIFKWYQSTTDHKYPLTSEQFLHGKAENIAKLITAGLTAPSRSGHAVALTDPDSSPNQEPLHEYTRTKENKETVLVKKGDLLDKKRSPDKKRRLSDIGAGDGDMSVRVSKELDFEITAVDVTEHGAEEWGGESANSSLKILRDAKKLVIYDGADLRDALKKDTNEFKEPYDAIMFNHVLHHYPSFASEISGVQQAISLLKQDGVLFFSEHANTVAEQDIHLQHIIFDIKNKLKYLKREAAAKASGEKSPVNSVKSDEPGSPPRISSPVEVTAQTVVIAAPTPPPVTSPAPSDSPASRVSTASTDSSEIKDSINFELNKAIDDYEARKGRDFYFSRPQFVKILQALGLELVAETPRTSTYDASQTVFYTFRKKAPYLTNPPAILPLQVSQMVGTGTTRRLAGNVRSADDSNLGDFKVSSAAMNNDSKIGHFRQLEYRSTTLFGRPNVALPDRKSSVADDKHSSLPATPVSEPETRTREGDRDDHMDNNDTSRARRYR